MTRIFTSLRLFRLFTPRRFGPEMGKKRDASTAKLTTDDDGSAAIDTPLARSRVKTAGSKEAHERALQVDYRATPAAYRIQRGEMGVYQTDPYSSELKPLWRFKDRAAAEESSKALWERFEEFRDEDDFVGMDVVRKFVQMGKTRSLRYALRPGGKKYDTKTGQEIAKSGDVADQSKYEGAQIFAQCLDRINEDAVYAKRKKAWKASEGDTDMKPARKRKEE